MLDYLIEDNNLKRYFEAENLSDLDLIFIKEIIFGKALPGNEDFVGRKPCKHFLYQVSLKLFFLKLGCGVMWNFIYG